LLGLDQLPLITKSPAFTRVLILMPESRRIVWFFMVLSFPGGVGPPYQERRKRRAEFAPPFLRPLAMPRGDNSATDGNSPK
jgi:hypothetical protein